MREDLHIHIHVYQDGTQTPGDLAGTEQRLLAAIEEQGVRIMGKLQLAQESLNAIDARTNEFAAVIDEVVAADAAEDAAYDAKVADLTAQVAALSAGQAIDAATIAELNAGLEALAAQGNNSAARLGALADGLRGTGTVASDPLPEVEVPAEVPGEIVIPAEPTGDGQ